MTAVAVRKFWPAAVAVFVALGLTLVGVSLSRSQRLTNLRLDEDGFSSKYLVFDKTNRRKCHVVNRREATMRRSDERQPGRKWNCNSFESVSGEWIWFLQSKRIGEGTVFLVPAAEVPDWSYPYVYEFVQRRRPELDLPRSSWIRLYTDRIYQGLFLWVELPFDKRKKDGGSGILRELLTVRGDELTVVDSRFNETRTLYVSALADGVLPALVEPLPELAWLGQRVPTASTTFLMSNEAADLSVLPLPVCLAELWERKTGRSASMFSDGRFDRWTEGAWRRKVFEQPPFSADELRLFHAEFDVYASRLAAELRAQEALEGDRLVTLLPQRQASVADLGLSFESGVAR